MLSDHAAASIPHVALFHHFGLDFEPVLDHEQVQLVGSEHPQRKSAFVLPRQLRDEVLFTYPVPRVPGYIHPNAFLETARQCRG